MSFYVWLFPLIFIVHDMEEIAGFITWLGRNKEWLRDIIGDTMYYKFVKPYENVTTEGFACAVFEELILCILICIISYATNFYGIWLGGFIGCMLHFVVHIVESIVIRKYIPALITSVICLPVGCAVIYESIKILKYSIGIIMIYSIVGGILLAINLKIAHRLMRRKQKI